MANNNLKNDIIEITKNIDAYTVTIRFLNSIADDINISDVHASDSINFRDALCHYVLLYEAYENNTEKIFYENRECIKEHLYRGIKDKTVFIASNIAKKLNHLISRDIFLQEKKQKKLRNYYHFFKNLTLKIRLKTIDIKRFEGIFDMINTLKEKLKELIPFLKKNRLDKLFTMNIFRNF